MPQRTLPDDCMKVLALIRDLQIEGIPRGWRRVPDRPPQARPWPSADGFEAVPYILLDACMWTTTEREGRPLADALRDLRLRGLVEAVTPPASMLAVMPAILPTICSPHGVQVRPRLAKQDGTWQLSEYTACEGKNHVAHFPIATGGPNDHIAQSAYRVTPAGIAAVAAMAGGESATGSSEAVPVPRGKLPKLGPHDKQAYQLSLIQGMKQSKIADALNKEHGTLYTQGQVSRMIARAKRHADASGLSERIPDPEEPAKAMNPDRLEIGKRVARRTSRQHEKRTSEPDE